MIATALRRRRQCFWIAIGLGVFDALAVFASASFGGAALGLICFWTIIPIAAFALGYAVPVRSWRWPIIMACSALVIDWCAVGFGDPHAALGLPLAFLGPAILGIIAAGLGSSLSRSERARSRAIRDVGNSRRAG